MIERIVYDVIKERLDWFKEDPDRIFEYFNRWQELGEDEAKKIRDFFRLDPAAGDAGGPPTLIHGFPRTSGPFPCWAIVLASDQLKQRYLGDDVETFDDEDDDDEWTDLDGQAATPQAQLIRYELQLQVCVLDSPDICLYYYHLLRGILFESQAHFHAHGLQNVEITGMDLNPYQNGLPENIWIRVISLGCEREEVSSEAKGTGTTLTGAHINDGVTDPAVEKNITPTVP